jgi:hypothetical protein
MQTVYIITSSGTPGGCETGSGQTTQRRRIAGVLFSAQLAIEP